MRENSCSICGEITNAKRRLCYIYVCWDCYKEQKGISEAFRIDEEVGKSMEKQIKKENMPQTLRQLQFDLARKFGDDKIPPQERIVHWGKANPNIRVHDSIVKTFTWTADVDHSKKWEAYKR